MRGRLGIFWLAILLAVGLIAGPLLAADSQTERLNLNILEKGSQNWLDKWNDNFEAVDEAYGSLQSLVADSPEGYRFSGTFASAGVQFDLPVAVDNTNEYVVHWTQLESASAGNVYVSKSASTFTIYDPADSGASFEATLYYLGTHNTYGATWARRWYVSPSSTITDHADASDEGSFAWVLCQVGSDPLTVELPGNKTYVITDPAVHSSSTVSFTSSTKVIADASGNFTTDGFAAGMTITVAGSSNNDGTYTVASVTATQLTVNESLSDEATGASVTIRWIVPENVELRLQHGAMLSVASGEQLVLASPRKIHAMVSRRIFQLADITAELLFNEGGIIYAHWFGWATSETAANNARHLNHAVASMAAGSVLDMGHNGEYSIDSATVNGFSNYAINVPEDYAIIRCWNKWGVKITLTGSSEAGFFYINKKHGFVIKNLHLYGNNVLNSAVYDPRGRAVDFLNDSASDYKGPEIYDCKFENFKGTAWIGLKLTGNGLITDTHIERNYFSGGGDYAPTNASVAADQIYLNQSTGSGYYYRIWIKDNTHYAADVKKGASIQGVAKHVWIENNWILNAGQTQGSGVKNAYAIMVYGAGEYININKNHALNAYTCGIYAITASYVSAMGNIITGQDETDDATLLRGALVLAATPHSNAIGNIIFSSYWGLQLQAVNSISNIVATNNQIYDCDNPIKIRENGSGGSRGVIASMNIIDGKSTATAIRLYGSANGIDHMQLHNNEIMNVATGINASLNNKWNNLSIISNKVDGSSYGLDLTQTGYYTRIESNDIFGDVSNYGIKIQGIVRGIFINNKIYEVSTGAAWYTPDAQGTLWGNQHYDVNTIISTTGSEDLGNDTPTWHGNASVGTRVQLLNQGAVVGGKFWIGWMKTGAASWSPIYVTDS